MANVFVLLALFLFHVTSASEPNVETGEEWKSLMEEKIDLLFGMMQDMHREMSELKRHQRVLDNILNVPTLSIGDVKKDPLMNDTDLEERVSFLEFQMVNVNEELVTLTEDLIDVENRVVNVEGQVTVILADQVIQDERLLELETDAESVAVAIVGLDSSINTLETADVALNDSIQGLDSRVSALEELNATIEDLEAVDSELATQIEDLSARLGRLEQEGTVGFHAFLGAYTSIPDETVIIFPNINVNIGNGYNGATGEFTVPSGGAGLYYFYGHFVFDTGESVWIRLQVNDGDICVAYEDGRNGPTYGGSSCGAVVLLQEGSIKKTKKLKITFINYNGESMQIIVFHNLSFLLLPTNVVCDVIFLHLSVSHSVHGGGVVSQHAMGQ